MRDDDRLLDLPSPEFGSGVIGVCDVCGVRQAVIVLSKERFRLCVIDFLNKAWLKTEKKPTAPAPVYRSDRVFFETTAVPAGRAPAIALSPTKVVRHPGVLVVPDVYGITTTVLDAAIRFAREGCEVLVPDLGKTDGLAAGPMLLSRGSARLRGGVDTGSKELGRLVRLCDDALEHLRQREMVDAAKSAVFGTAFGGSVALAFAAQSNRPTVVEVAYPLPLRPPALAKLITAPLLCVVGSRDRTSARAVAQLRAALPGEALVVDEVDGARHQFLSRDLGAYDLGRAEAAWGRIIEFAKARLMPPPPPPPPPPARPTDPLAGVAPKPAPA